MLDNEDKWYRLSLRLFGDDLDLERATSILGLEPDVAANKGEHIRGDPRVTYATSTWVHRRDREDDNPFEDQLPRLVAELEKRGEPVRELFSRPDVTAELFLGFSSGNGQGGFVLSAALLDRIARLGLDLMLDLYPPTIDEE